MSKDGDARREWVDEIIDADEGVYLADGFDEAIIGISERAGRSRIVAYDRDKCIEIIISHSSHVGSRSTEDGLTCDEKYEEAVEYFDYNVIGSWLGDGTPEFLTLYNEN